MVPPVDLEKVLPIYKVEGGCILSRGGDFTVAYELTLPEIFTLSVGEYEALHQLWIKAVKSMPRHSVFHKQDWFTAERFQPDFDRSDLSFLSRASERFFHERPYLDHRCYLMLTQRAADRKPASSLFSGLLRRTLVPETALNPLRVQAFLDAAGQVERILGDSGLVKLRRLGDEELASTPTTPGLLERYCYLLPEGRPSLLKDIHLRDELRIGDQYCGLYTLANGEDLPAFCGARLNYDRYSTDRTHFSVGFASSLGQLLPCNHLYNQYLFIGDAPKTIKSLESRRLRLQSLSMYSRENAISRDAVNDFLNEAIGQQRLPVKAHFNVLVWTDRKEELPELKTMVSSALAQMDAATKQETDGAPQIFWAESLRSVLFKTA